MAGQRRGKRRDGSARPREEELLPAARRLHQPPDPRFSRSLEYGLALLECFNAGRTLAGIIDFSSALEIGRSTAHRYATTLHALGYLEQDEHRKYRLGRLALDPGLAALAIVRASVPDAAPILAELRDRTGHTVGMGVLDGARAIYVHRLLAHGAGQYEADLGLGAGASLPLHCTALGGALLASLAEQERTRLIEEMTLAKRGPKSSTSRRRLAAAVRAIGENGTVLSDEELAPGVRSLAVAVALPEGDGVRPGAIEVTVPASACTMDRLAEQYGPLVREAAERLASATADRRAQRSRSGGSSRRRAATAQARRRVR